MAQWLKGLAVAAWLGASLVMWQHASRVVANGPSGVRQPIEASALPTEVVTRLAARYPQARLRTADKVWCRDRFVWYDVRLEQPDGGRLSVECTPAGTILDVAEE